MMRNNTKWLLCLAMLSMALLTGCSAKKDTQKETEITDAIDATEETAGETTLTEETSSVQTTDANDSENAEETKVHVKVPDFEMTLLTGETVHFSDYEGKKILLNFWATWCGPCVGEMPALEQLAQEYSEELVILAVNCAEDQGTVSQFIEKNGYTFPVVMDNEEKIQAVFGGISSIPVTAIIDEEGYLVDASTGAQDADTMYKKYKEMLELP
ncbi:MAG: TlpA disulfide reductase family protein [Eubacteriales bacterium]|nr:TlpA disulfide reductase family protein [Eubacteriales bacterium]